MVSLPGTLPEVEQKKRRACDECRTRKLACSKEPDGCRRCQREGIACVFSVQKPMGRPRKRPHLESEDVDMTGLALAVDHGMATLATASAAPNATSQGVDVDVDVGLSMLMDQISPAGVSFFELLGVDGETIHMNGNGNGNNNDDNSFLDPFLQTTHGSLPTLPVTNNNTQNQIPSAFAAMPDLSPPPTSRELSAQRLQPAQPARTTANQTLHMVFPHSLFGENVASLDFSTDSAVAWESGMPDIVGTANNSSSSSTMSPGSSPEVVKGQAQPLIPTASNSYTQQQQQPLHNPPTDSCSKASAAAWLLTAPNRVCGCLARLYLALDSLQHLPTDIGPAMRVARNAAHTAHDAVMCPSCSPPPNSVNSLNPLNSLQSFQNLMLLGALLPSLAHTYQRIVRMVDEEAARAAAAKVRLPVMLAEYGGVWGHMAGGWDNVCAQASTTLNNSVVDPPLWRLVVRALLKMDVYGIHLDRADTGPDSSSSGITGTGTGTGTGANKTAAGPLRIMGCKTPTAASLPVRKEEEENEEKEEKDGGSHTMVPVHFGLKDIADMMASRARVRHQCMDAAYDAGLLKGVPGAEGYRRLPAGEKHHCERVIEIAKQEIDRLVIV